MNTRHCVLAVLLACALLVSGTASAGTDRYCDPFLFPSSRLGNFVGLDVDPVFARPYNSRLPTQNFLGVSGEFLTGKKSSFRLTFGQAQDQSEWRNFGFFQDIRAELKSRMYSSPHAWVSWFLDMEWARFTNYLGLMYVPVGETSSARGAYNYTTHSYASIVKMKDGTLVHSTQEALSFTMAFSNGFLIANHLNFEYYFGFKYGAIDAGHSAYWKKYATLEVPIAFRVSWMVIPNGHADLEFRTPVQLGVIDKIDARVYADMSVGWRHSFFDRLFVGGAFFWGLNHMGDAGRDKGGLIMTAKYLFF